MADNGAGSASSLSSAAGVQFSIPLTVRKTEAVGAWFDEAFFHPEGNIVLVFRTCLALGP
jgi:hypothetical protein